MSKSTLHPEIAEVLAGTRRWCVVTGDCLDILPTLPDGCVDAVVTDPPYGIPVGAAFVRKNTMDVEDGSGTFNESGEVYAWLHHPCSLLRDGGHVAFFIDRATGVEAQAACVAGGLSVWQKFYLVKDAPPPTPRPTFVSAVEECIIAEKRRGKRRWYGGGYTPNRWIGLTPNRLDAGCGHPSEKPLAPMLTLVEALSPDAGTVLDPFVGSGTTGVAAIKTGRRFIGIEIDEKYADIARRRIGEADTHLFNADPPPRSSASSAFSVVPEGVTE